jgi:uncharacterized protein
VPRLLEGLEVPRLGLIGPWGHTYPHLGSPGPAIGFLQETLRWWDQWLKGIDTGIMDEPRLRAWLQEGAPPATSYDERPGRWVGEPGWPSPHIRTSVHPLARGRIEEPGTAVEPERLEIATRLDAGLDSGAWCSYGGPDDLPGDQRQADDASLTFDGPVLEEPLEILGAPVVHLELQSDRPVAMVAVRLSDVQPDGRVTRVTYGLLNLTHRDGHAEPEPLVPGRSYRVRVQMNDAGQTFEPGHRIRLAISPSYWPIAWPAPEPVTLTLTTGSSELHLPVRPTRPEDDEVGVAMPAVGAPRSPITVVQPATNERRWVHDPKTGEAALEVIGDGGTFRFDDIDLEVTSRTHERYTHVDDDPTSVRGEIWWTTRYRRGDWNVGAETHTVLSSDSQRFQIRADVQAFEDDEVVFERTFARDVERDLV